MKKIFPIIIILIAVSVLGIIAIQINWLQNMLLLREDQVKQKVIDVSTKVGVELAQYKGVFPAQPSKKVSRLWRRVFLRVFQAIQRGTTVYRQGTV